MINNYFFKAVLIIIGLLNLAIPSHSQNPSKELIINELYSVDGEQYFRFKVPDMTVVNKMSRIISIDRTDQSGNVFAYANRKEFSAFLDYNFDYEILQHPGDLIENPNMKDKIEIRGIQDWDFYPTYEAYVDMMNQFAADYPSLCQVFSIGTTPGGREILIAKVSANVTIKENEPQFLYTSSIHGDELTGYVLMLRLIDYLLSNYGTLPKVTNLVDNVEIWINPLANPDGTYAGGNNTVSGARRYNSNWVDINRNYPDPEDGPHPDGEDWQPETVMFMDMAEENHFVSSVNLHGGEEVCNYPWDTWSKLSADDNWWQYVCHQYADTVHLYAPAGYMSDFDNGITNGYAWYSISGGRQDYMNYFHQDREFTLEISDVKTPAQTQLPLFWNYNYRSFLNYCEQSTFGLRGTVKDSVTGWPLKAEVYAVLHEMDSSWVYSALPNGNYHRLLYAGNYTVRFSAPGYQTRVVNNVNIVNGQATVLNLKLLPDGVGGIDNAFVSARIGIFPNPVVHDMVYIRSELEIVNATVYNVQGKELCYKFSKGINAIDLSGITPGMYFIRFDTDMGIGMKKFVVSKNKP